MAAYVLRGESLLGSPSSDWMDTSTVRTLYAALHLSCRAAECELHQMSHVGKMETLVWCGVGLETSDLDATTC